MQHDQIYQRLKATIGYFKTSVPENYLSRISEWLGRRYKVTQVEEALKIAVRDNSAFPSIADMEEILRKIKTKDAPSHDMKLSPDPCNFCSDGLVIMTKAGQGCRVFYCFKCANGARQHDEGTILLFNSKKFWQEGWAPECRMKREAFEAEMPKTDTYF